MFSDLDLTQLRVASFILKNKCISTYLSETKILKGDEQVYDIYKVGLFQVNGFKQKQI